MFLDRSLYLHSAYCCTYCTEELDQLTREIPYGCNYLLPFRHVTTSKVLENYELLDDPFSMRSPGMLDAVDTWLPPAPKLTICYMLCYAMLYAICLNVQNPL